MHVPATPSSLLIIQFPYSGRAYAYGYIDTYLAIQFMSTLIEVHIRLKCLWYLGVRVQS
jgi:hypothetical protein